MGEGDEAEVVARAMARAPRDVVMDQLWESIAKGLATGDFRLLPGIIFEDLEPIFEGVYEAGQDNWRDWLGTRGAAIERYVMRQGSETGDSRPKFSEWWLRSSSE